MWLVGGWDSSATSGTAGGMGEILGDVWTLDIDNWVWEAVTIKGEALPAISRFQMKAIGSKLWIHHHRCSEDILVLETETRTLFKYPVTGAVPSSRGLHSMAAVGGSLYVFGCQGKVDGVDVFMNDLAVLDTETLVWSSPKTTGKTPSPRCAVASAVMGSSIWFYGGASKPHEMAKLSESMLGDVVVFDTLHQAWEWPRVGAGPAARNAHSLTTNKGELVMVGGWKAFEKTYIDVWTLRKRKAPPVEWQEDDYVLVVWCLGAVIAILLFVVPGVPPGYWMIPGPFVPLVAWKGISKLVGGNSKKSPVVPAGSKAGETKKTQ